VVQVVRGEGLLAEHQRLAGVVAVALGVWGRGAGWGFAALHALLEVTDAAAQQQAGVGHRAADGDQVGDAPGVAQAALFNERLGLLLTKIQQAAQAAVKHCAGCGQGFLDHRLQRFAVGITGRQLTVAGVQLGQLVVVFMPEVADDVVGNHAAQAVAHDDDALVVTLIVQGAQQVYTISTDLLAHHYVLRVGA